MKNVYAVIIPTPNGDCNDVEYNQFLFDQPPTRQDVIDVIEDLSLPGDDVYCLPQLSRLILDLKTAIDQIFYWKMLTGITVISTDHVNVTVKEKTIVAPFSWEKINVYTPNSVK